MSAFAALKAAAPSPASSRFANPHYVADHALRACINGDMESFKQVLIVQPQLSETSTNFEVSRVFKRACGAINNQDAVRGIFWLHQPHTEMAAIIRRAESGQSAVYFRLVRQGEQYLLKELVTSPSDPVAHVEVL
jgi:hypothetical protein